MNRRQFLLGSAAVVVGTAAAPPTTLSTLGKGVTSQKVYFTKPHWVPTKVIVDPKIYIDFDLKTGLNDGSSWENALRGDHSLSRAIRDMVVAGDELVVRGKGTIENCHLNVNELKVEGGNDTNVTIHNCVLPHEGSVKDNFDKNDVWLEVEYDDDTKRK